MPRDPSRRLLTLRKELAYQRRHHPQRIQAVLLACLAVSGLSGVLLWRHASGVINAQIEQQLRTNLGLLDLRVNQHKTTVLDWGHWDSLYNFSGGGYPQFVQIELAPSSIIADQQGMVIFDARGRLLVAMPRGLIDRGLMACLQQRFKRLRELSPTAADDKAFGLFCRIGDASLIGAGTGIRPSRERRPERGWVFHLSTMERPSFNSDLNQAFRAMSQSIDLRGNPAQTRHAEPSASISELLQPGDRFLLRSPQSNWQSARRAGEAMLPPWLGLNALLVGMVTLGLSTARQRRLPGRIREIQDQRSARALRRRLGTLLMNRRQLLLAIGETQTRTRGDWLVAVRLWNRPPDGARARLNGSHEKRLFLLADGLSQALHPEVMGEMDEQTIALAVRAESPDDGEELRQRIGAVLDECRASSSQDGDLRISATMEPIKEADPGQQLISLCDRLANRRPDQISVQQPCSTAPPLEEHTSGVHSDDTERWLRSLEDGFTALVPVWWLSLDPLRPAFQELVFKPPAATTPPDLVEQLDLISNPSSAELVDAYMLRQAMQWLSRCQPQDSCVVRIHGSSWCSDHHFQALIDRLVVAPAALRQRLILAVSEASLSRSVDLHQTRSRRLQQLGVRICVDAFGDGVVPVQAVFALQPSMLRLSADLAGRLNDPNGDTMVEFLVAYCRYQGCLLVMPGIDTEASRRHWSRRGVQALQGAAAGPQQASTRGGADTQPVIRLNW